MTDLTSNAPPRERRKAMTWEYRVYFTIIFLLSLPFALASCALSLLRPGVETDGNFIALAWRKAAIITPTIFSV